MLALFLERCMRYPFVGLKVLKEVFSNIFWELTIALKTWARIIAGRFFWLSIKLLYAYGDGLSLRYNFIFKLLLRLEKLWRINKRILGCWISFHDICLFDSKFYIIYELITHEWFKNQSMKLDIIRWIYTCIPPRKLSI